MDVSKEQRINSLMNTKLQIKKQIDLLEADNEKLKKQLCLLDNNIHHPLLNISNNGNTVRDIIISKEKQLMYEDTDSRKITLSKSNALFPVITENNVIKKHCEVYFSEDSIKIIKNWTIEGKLRQIAYVIQVTSEKYNSDDDDGLRGDKLITINAIDIARSSPELDDFKAYILGTSNIHEFFHGLQRLQILEEERNDAGDQLLNVPDLVIEGQHSNELFLTYQATAKLEINITWKIVLTNVSEKRPSFKNLIQVTGSKGVAARFSRSHAYSYLAGKETLQDKDDVLMFFENFQK